jgi:hypothetical protein
MIGNQPPKTYLPENVHLHLLKLNNHNNQNAEHLLNEMVELLGILTGKDDNSALLSLLGIKNLTDAFISFGNLIGKYIQPNVFDKEPYDALDWKILRFLAQAVQALKNQHLLNQQQDEERDRAKNQEKTSPELLFVEEFFSNSETKKEFSSIQLYLKELQKIELSRLDDHPYQTTICRLEIPLLVSFTQNYFLQFSYFQLALDYWQKLTPALGTEDNLNDRLIIVFLFISLGFVSELFLPEIVFPLSGSNEKETKDSENNYDNHENNNNNNNNNSNSYNNKRKRTHTTEELKSCFERMREFSSFYCSGNTGTNSNNNTNPGSGERGGGDRGAGRNELCPIAPAPSLDPHHSSSLANQLKLEEIPLVASPPFSPFSPPANDHHYHHNNNQSTMTGTGAAAMAFPTRLTEKTIHDLLYQESNPALFLFYRESVFPLLSKHLPRITENLGQRLSAASSEATSGGKKGLATDFHSSMSMLLPAHLPSMDVFHTSLLKSRSSFASGSYDCLMNRDEQLSPEESIRHCLQQLKKAEQLIWELLTRHLDHPLLTVSSNGCSGTGTPRSAAAQAALAANDPQRRGSASNSSSSANSTVFPTDFFRIVFLYDYYIDYYLLTIKAEGQRLASQLSSSSTNNNNNNSVPGGASSPSPSPASFIASLIHQEEIHKYLNHSIHYPSEIYELAYHYNHYYSYNSNNMSSCCSFWENHSFYYQSRIIAIKRYFPIPGQNTNTVVTEGQESKTGSRTASRTGTPPQSRPLPHHAHAHSHSPHLIHHSTSSPTHSSRSSSGSSSPVTLGGLPVTTLKEFTHQLEKHLSQQQEQHK